MLVVDQTHSDVLFKLLIARHITSSGTPNQLIALLQAYDEETKQLKAKVSEHEQKLVEALAELDKQKEIIKALQSKVNTKTTRSKAA